jgi:hypothetical protein
MKLLYHIDGRLILYWAWFDGWIGYRYDPIMAILYLTILPTVILAIFLDPQRVENYQKEHLL